MNDLTACAQDLVLAIFRLAVCDYLGMSYGHDVPDRQRRVAAPGRDEAARFLQSPWAQLLGDVVGLSAPTVWKIARARAVDLRVERSSLFDKSASEGPAWSPRLAA
jgi:hypothetical protein